jgi:hypothetical protein
MNQLPVYADIIIHQGRTFTLPICLRTETFDTDTGEVVESTPWDASDYVGRFVVRPIIAVGEYGDAVIDTDVPGTGVVEMGVQGIPGFETSVFVWLPATATAGLTPWSLAVWEVTGTRAGEPESLGRGHAMLQRAIVPLP